MTPYLDDGDVKLYHGDALEQLALMPSESVQCIVTSPPFWGLRDYGTGTWQGGDEACDHTRPLPTQQGDPTIRKSTLQSNKKTPGLSAGTLAMKTAQASGSFGYRDTCGKCGATRVDQQIGLEETPDEWCARIVAVMREARRVLRNDGVCWIEVGDTYCANTRGASADNRPEDGGYQAWSGAQTTTVAHPFKPKDLVGAPWLLAFALRQDGWYLRSDTIWARPNPMPESVTDRPTKAHSYVFLLTKSARYYYDADAIREEAAFAQYDGSAGELREASGQRKSDAEGVNGRNVQATNAEAERRDRVGGSFNNNPRLRGNVGRNARSVWTIATEPTPFAHFATFPQALVERCIKAGTSEHGACSECGAPWRRITERGELTAAENSRFDAATFTADAQKSGGDGTGLAVGKAAALARGGYVPNHYRPAQTTGWEPSCECLPNTRADTATNGPDSACLDDKAHEQIVPCVVLDPFMGSATTALVARRLGRHAIGIELNAEYLAIAAKRLQQLSLLT